MLLLAGVVPLVKAGVAKIRAAEGAVLDGQDFAGVRIEVAQRVVNRGRGADVLAEFGTLHTGVLGIQIFETHEEMDVHRALIGDIDGSIGRCLPG